MSLTPHQRMGRYLAQTGRRNLTARQLRRFTKKSFRNPEPDVDPSMTESVRSAIFGVGKR